MSKIKALFIFEVMGKPPEHIIDSLEKLVLKLDEQKGIEIIRKEIHDAKKVEEENSDMHTSFAEVELFADDINLISLIVLNMLPAHIEILEPADHVFKNFELSSLLSDLTLKVHKYDEMAKVMMFERQNLLTKLKETEDKVREYDKNFEGVVKVRGEEDTKAVEVSEDKGSGDKPNEDERSDGENISESKEVVDTKTKED